MARNQQNAHMAGILRPVSGKITSVHRSEYSKRNTSNSKSAQKLDAKVTFSQNGRSYRNYNTGNVPKTVTQSNKIARSLNHY